MLTKLMRYDFRAVLTFWWIPAVILLGLSPLTGLFLYLSDHMEMTSVMYVTVSFIMGLLVFVYVITFAVTIFLFLFACFRRLYTHFYTDEGYLTFTLPVPRRTLLLSKTLVTFIMTAATGLVCCVSIMLLFVSGGAGADFFGGIGRFFKGIFETYGGVGALYIAEVAVLAVLLLCFYLLLIQFSITLGAILAKKLKLLAAFGLYYAISNALGFLLVLFVQFLSAFTAAAAFRFAGQMSMGRLYGIIGLILFMGMLFLALLDTMLYLLTLSSIERRLNLA